ncbi:rare lipoprotein A precursor [Caedimonas varicaedens]|jgi:rare lipoprotein A|uniref:Endolytic peptidoglycan transglycosylase RlpA n=1 Tax=Caedimonas varicaedens TaxID=1629334 RepID=A0A0K8MCT1_9PROT|nr:rare lipoprotein A precursor [Caedimonas varicaedens]
MFAKSGLGFTTPKGFQKLGRRTSGESRAAYIKYVSRTNSKVQRPWILKGEEYIRRASIYLCMLFLAGCGSQQVEQTPYFCDSTTGVCTPCEPKFAKKAYNKSYEIKGITYTPQPHYELSEVGIASYYGGTDIFHGRKTSNGEIFDMNRLSAAHKTALIPCVVQVTNLENGRSIKVKINDRGPFIEGRVIDVSRKVAQLLGFYHKGTAKVHVKTVMPDTIMLARGHLDDEAMQLAEVSTGEAAAFILPPVTSFSTPQLKTTGKQKDQEIYLASSSPYEADSAVLQKKIEEISAIYEPDSAILQRKIEEASTMDAPSVSPVRVSVRPVKKSPMPVRTVTPQIRPAVTPVLSPAMYRQPSALPPIIRGNRGYFVQAGTFRNSASAQNVHKGLQKLFTSPYVKSESVRFGQTKIFRILVGPFRSSQEANMLLKKVSSAGHDEAVVVYNG